MKKAGSGTDVSPSTIDFRLYVITDRRLLPVGTFVERIIEIVTEGIKVVQLREKDLSAREQIELAKKLREYPAKLFINDRADITQAIGADGLHIPEHSFPVDEARKIIGNILIGKSAHSLESALHSEKEGADFITFGPVYDTPSKLQYGKPLGIEKLHEVTQQISIPVFAIGGIDPERAKVCIDAGAFGVSVISDLFGADNPKPQIQKYREALGAL